MIGRSSWIRRDGGEAASKPKTSKTLNPKRFKQPPIPPTPDPEWNKHQIENITQDILLGPAFNLLKGTCSSSIQLEYNFQECFNALTDKLDWNNPKGEVTYTISITKTKDARYEIKEIKDMVPTLWSTIKHAYNKDESMGIKHWGERRKLWYRSQSVSVNELHGYGQLEEIVVKRSYQ
ncbi:hypothetical protein Tco_0386063 [Tanacetum coccineum]